MSFECVVFILVSVTDSSFSMLLLMMRAARVMGIHPVRRRGESMTSQLNECCFMNAVTETNAQAHSVSGVKTNKRFKRKQDGENK